jgi:5-(carboxyamino)imidazole ribonucleotide mutase
MGSLSDWKTLSATAAILEEFKVPYEKNVVSAHRTPHWLASYAGSAKGRGLQVIIAGAGGAAHLPGMAAAFTTLPVLGVPVESRALKGLDSLLSIAQMPAGVPVGTLAIGEPGAKNAALLAISILALQDEKLRRVWEGYRARLTRTVRAQKLPMRSRTLEPAPRRSKGSRRPPGDGRSDPAPGDRGLPQRPKEASGIHPSD